MSLRRRECGRGWMVSPCAAGARAQLLMSSPVSMVAEIRSPALGGLDG